MFDQLKRLSAPLVWALIGIVGVLTVFDLGRWIWMSTTTGGSWSSASYSYAWTAGPVPDLAYLALVLVLLGLAAFRPTPKSLPVQAAVAAGLGAFSLVIGLVQVVLAMIYKFSSVPGYPGTGMTKFWSTILGLGHLAFLGLELFVAFTVFRLAKAAETGAPAAVTAGAEPQGQRPIWQPDQASGGAWTRAGDAASGASASAWGTPGSTTGGWQPQSQPSAQPQLGQGQQGQGQQGQQSAWHAPAQPQWNAASQGSAQPQPGQQGNQWQASAQGQWGGAQNQGAQNQGQQRTAWDQPATQPSASPWPTAGQQASGSVDNQVAEDGEGTILRPAPQWRPAERPEDQQY